MKLMKYLKDRELEIKVVIITIILFAIFGFFSYRIFTQEIDAIISNGTNRNLISYLQERVAQNPEDYETNEILLRQMQWEVSAPFIAQTQKDNIKILLFYSIFLLVLVILSVIVYFTHPIKKLAKAVEKIGKGEYVKIETQSRWILGSKGFLGNLELEVAKMQDELKILHEKEQIAATQKAWQDIARVMAHEIKNPLTPMRLLIDKIDEKNSVEDKISSEDLKKFTERMNRQLNALEILVNKFRSFSKSQVADCSIQNLYSAVKDIAEDFQNDITTKISGSKNAIAFFDKNFLAQILLNIYKNSVNAGAKNMSVSIHENENFVEISLADDGKGIARENLDKIFLPYITFSEGGSGIGLSVVKNLCESMGGECFAESSENGGFKMILKLKTKN